MVGPVRSLYSSIGERLRVALVALLIELAEPYRATPGSRDPGSALLMRLPFSADLPSVLDLRVV
jgi:hypothetical protein